MSEPECSCRTTVKLGSTSRPLSEILRRFDEALAILAEIAQMSPDRPQAKVNRALIHLLCGDLVARLGRLRQPAQDLPDQRASRLPALGRNTAERRCSSCCFPSRESATR